MAEYNTIRTDHFIILEISGRIEPDNWQEMNAVFDKLTQDDDVKNILVDLSGLEYTASAGFRELFMAGKKLARKGGRLAVCSLQADVQKIFDLAGFATAYPIFENRADAAPHFVN